MASKTLITKNLTLNMWFGRQIPDLSDIPEDWEYALLDGDGDELIGNGYARFAVENNVTNFPTSTTGQTSNLAEVNFGTATTDWETVEQIAIIDAVSNEAYFIADLPSPVSVLDGQEAKYNVGVLVFREL